MVLFRQLALSKDVAEVDGLLLAVQVLPEDLAAIEVNLLRELRLQLRVPRPRREVVRRLRAGRVLLRVRVRLG